MLLVLQGAVGILAQGTMPSVGDGSEANPYQISTADHLVWFRANFNERVNGEYLKNSCFKLMNDIDLSSVCGDGVGNWQTIGHYSYFYGTFDGNNKTISGLYVNSPKTYGYQQYGPLFYSLSTNCVIKDLTLADVDITVMGSASALAFEVPTSATNVRIENVRTTGSINITESRGAAGILYQANGGVDFINCVNEINLSSANYSYCYELGGLVCSTGDAIVNFEGCVNNGNLNCPWGNSSNGGHCAGIVVGYNKGTMNNCINVGNITAGGYINAGLVASVNGQTDVTITNSLNLGNIQGIDAISHIVGATYNGGSGATPRLTIDNCYWSADATVLNTSGESATTSQMQTPYLGSKHSSTILSLGTTGSFTAEQLQSGMAAMVMQGDQATTAWGQDLAAHQAYPQPSNTNQVYLSQGYIDCLGNINGGGEFTNTPSSGEVRDHDMPNGVCSVCGTLSVPAKDGDYYLIYNAGQMLWFAQEAHDSQSIKCRLMADIDLSTVCHPADPEHDIEAVDWPGVAQNYKFYGHIDGNHHTISNLYIGSAVTDYTGFIHDYMNGTMNDLTFDNAFINSTASYVGVAVGILNTSATLQNVTVSNSTVVSENNSVGGVVGYLSFGNMMSCRNEGTSVSGKNNVGGIVGNNRYPQKFSDCVNNGSVYGTGYDIGGVMGRLEANSSITVERCINNADINISDAAVTYLGGICGDATDGKIIDCYNYGNITLTKSGVQQIGGIVGQNATNCKLQYCLNDGSITIADARSSYFGLITGTGARTSITRCYVNENAVLSLSGVAQTGYKRFYGYDSHTAEVGNVVVADATAEDYTSGALAYNLQYERTGNYWGQLIGTENVPVVGSTNTVYLNGTTDCFGNFKSGTYTNTPVATVHESHVFDKFDICTNCHTGHEPAVVDDVLQIATIGNLVWFRNQVNTIGTKNLNAALTNNIDLTEYCEEVGDWTPIGTGTSGFTGTFDGKGYCITGVSITSRNSYLGFIGYTNSPAYIRNLTVEGNIICDYMYSNFAGLIVGGFNGNEISNCTARGSVKGGSYVGGVAGYALGTITGCTNEATVESINTGASNVGGVVGKYDSSYSVTNCANYGNVTSAGYYVGGLTGYVSSSSAKISNCANYGNVTAKYSVGGLCGWSVTTSWDKCFNGGNVTSSETGNVSYLMGYISNKATGSLYYDASKPLTIAGNVDSTPDPNAIALTAYEVQNGKAAVLLGDAWGQEIGADMVPVLGGLKVYYGNYLHADEEPVYAEPKGSNTEKLNENYECHSIKFGVCSICGMHNGQDISFNANASYDDWDSGVTDHSKTTENLWVFTGCQTGNKITFDWKVSSESGYDFLNVYVVKPDDTEEKVVASKSGEANGSYVYDIPADGTYKLRAAYSKDGSASSGNDKAWISNLVAPGMSETGIIGDVNESGIFDKADIDTMRGMITRYTKPADAKADFNGDGKVTVSDITIAVKELLP